LTILERPAPKRDGASQTVVNGEHETVTKAVVGSTLGLSDYRQTTLDQQVMREPLFLHRLIQSIPRCRRVAQPKTDRHFLCYLARARGRAGCVGRRIAEQTLMKERCGCLMQDI